MSRGCSWSQCNTRQRTATACNALQQPATHYNTLPHTAMYGDCSWPHCNTPQHTATLRSTLQCLQAVHSHKATHRITRQHTAMSGSCSWPHWRMPLAIKRERQEREVPGCNNGMGGFHEKFPPPPPPPLLHPKKFKWETGKRTGKRRWNSTKLDINFQKKVIKFKLDSTVRGHSVFVATVVSSLSICV